MKDGTNMLHVLPSGEWEIVKHTKNGTYIKQGKIKIFIPKTDIDIEKLEKESEEQ